MGQWELCSMSEDLKLASVGLPLEEKQLLGLSDVGT